MSLHRIHFLTTKIHKLLYHTPKKKKKKKKKKNLHYFGVCQNIIHFEISISIT